MIVEEAERNCGVIAEELGAMQKFREYVNSVSYQQLFAMLNISRTVLE